MVWGAISYHGRSNLLRSESNLNSNRYVCEGLQPEVVPFLQGILGLPQQDNARLHVAKTVQLNTWNFFLGMLIGRIVSPIVSPLSPIVYV
ncbi:uncharacterized protein TNCV_2804511 [Trichonephila clavipes]|nr:uncharacterized protein TNCV_2804511 [Trichonephila clavipes]